MQVFEPYTIGISTSGQQSSDILGQASLSRYNDRGIVNRVDGTE
jgi:hypothetical protein